MYSGPFKASYDACNARLHGPADAFIKVADPVNFRTFYSCLCPTDSTVLPTLNNIGQKSVWVGEVQRAMEKLGYKIPGLQGEPGVPTAWGQFTAETASVIVKFQTDTSLPRTGIVAQSTWDTVKASVC